MVQRFLFALLAIFWLAPAQAATYVRLYVPFSFAWGSGILVGNDINGDGFLSGSEFSRSQTNISESYVKEMARQNRYFGYGPSAAVVDFSGGSYASSFTPIDISAAKIGDTFRISLQSVIGFWDNRMIPRGSAVDYGTFTGTIAPIPLPATGAMLLGCLALLWRRRRA